MEPELMELLDCIGKKVMGYNRVSASFRPDKPETGQIWMVVEKMRELGWILNWNNELLTNYYARFYNYELGIELTALDPNPCLAILQAACRAHRHGL